MKKILIILLAAVSWSTTLAAEECSQLTAAECAHSKRCIVDCHSEKKNGGRFCKDHYFCREPKTECERSWKPDYMAGENVLREQCEKISGCNFESYACVCPCSCTSTGPILQIATDVRYYHRPFGERPYLEIIIGYKDRDDFTGIPYRFL